MVRVNRIHASATLVAALALPAVAGITYNVPDSDAYLSLAGRVQLQYHMTDPDAGPSTDELIFRRLRLTVTASVHPDWVNRLQVEYGKNDVNIVDAYMQYKGYDWVDITIGNYNTPFSRASIVSSKKLQMVERPFTGDHNYGTSDRHAGVHLEGNLAEKRVQWGLALVKAATDPDNRRIDFDSVVSLSREDDWSEGEMAVGRVEVFPLGAFAYDQGDFNRERRFAVGVAGFAWGNDEDALEPNRAEDTANDIDSVTGFEISAAVRGCGFSVDAEYNRFESKLIDAGITSGLYVDSETTLENWSVIGGYMILPGKVEGVVEYQEQDADGYAEPWTRTSVGLNYFIHKHDIKTQVTYRMGENLDGVAGKDADELFVQMQYVF